SGIHTITAAVQDSGGRTAVAEVTVTSNAAPHVSIDAPADGSLFGPTDSITLSAAATDLEDGNLGGGVAWTSDLDGALGTGATLGTGTSVVSTLRSGTHTISASVTDRGGKSAVATLTLVVNAAPTVQLVAPASGATFAPDEPVTLTAGATDTEDGDLSGAVG